MPPSRPAKFEAWVKTLKDRPEATEQVLETFYQAGGLLRTDADHHPRRPPPAPSSRTLSRVHQRILTLRDF